MIWPVRSGIFMEVLRADAHFAKVLLQFGRNAIALHGLLNGLVVRPDVEPPLGEIRQRVVRLLGERRGEVPRTHHVQVILLALHIRHPREVFRPEIRIEIMPHQHADCVAHGVEFFR